MKLAEWSASRASRLTFWAAALFALVMALIPQPPEIPGNPSDKLQHIVAFATLGMLGTFAYPRAPALRLVVGLSLFGAFIEVAQAIPFLHRDSDPLDWLADTAACALAVIAVRWWESRRGASALRRGAPPPICAATDKGICMTQFDDRERAFETKFAHDEEMKFRITARRNRLLGQWAARQMGLTEAEAESYAADVIRSDFEEAGEHDVIRKVLGDLTAAGVECDEDQVREVLHNKEIDARRQIIESTNL